MNLKPFILPLIALILIFIADLLLPLGYTHWIIYIIPLFLSYRTEKSVVVYFTLGVAGFFILLGFLLSPGTEIPVVISIINRFTGFFSFAVFTLIVNSLIVSKEEIKLYSENLKSMNHELETFSYSVSHDLRAPLRSIQGFSKILQEEFSEKLGEEGTQYLRYIANSSEKMGMLIGDMLKLSRVSSQQMELRDVDMREIANSVLADLRRAEPQRGVEFKTRGRLLVRGDYNLIRILLVNLISNAWKYTSKQQEAKIEFGVDVSKAGQKTYYIKDNGAGFDMAYSDKLFKPFARLHSEKEFSGTGVGLPIAERVVKRHGGEIWAEGEKGRGAVFYFTLNT